MKNSLVHACSFTICIVLVGCQTSKSSTERPRPASKTSQEEKTTPHEPELEVQEYSGPEINSDDEFPSWSQIQAKADAAGEKGEFCKMVAVGQKMDLMGIKRIGKANGFAFSLPEKNSDWYRALDPQVRKRRQYAFLTKRFRNLQLAHTNLVQTVSLEIEGGEVSSKKCSEICENDGLTDIDYIGCL